MTAADIHLIVTTVCSAVPILGPMIVMGWFFTRK